MKTLNDYMAMSYRMEIVEDKEEGGFVVFYPDLPGCITCGETIESAVENAQDAGIPVVNVNDGLIASADYYVGPNAYQNGQLVKQEGTATDKSKSWVDQDYDVN